MNHDLKLLLDRCSHNPDDHFIKAVAADCADENNLPSLGKILRHLSQHKIIPLFTGSRCYGTPREELFSRYSPETGFVPSAQVHNQVSDWDWVIKIQHYPRQALHHMADTVTDEVKQGYPEGGYHDDNRLDCALRYGPLNIICVSSNVQLDTWTEGTKQLITESPVTRDRAVEVFQAEFLRQQEIRRMIQVVTEHAFMDGEDTVL